MKRMPTGCEYNSDLEEKFISDAIIDLKQGLTTYVYKERVLNKLKQAFNDLEIRKNEFYWSVRCKEKLKPKKGRPRKLEVKE